MLRVLFATTAGEGHFAPMIPLAKACLAAGHEVLVAAPASFARTVAAAGLPHAPFADVDASDMGQVMAQLPAMSFEEANRTVIREIFAGLDARAALPGVSRVLDEWQPAVVVREPAEFASLLTSVAAGVPQVQVAAGVRLMGELLLTEVEEPLATLASSAGFDFGETWQALLQLPTITFVPEIMDEVDLGERRQALSRFGEITARPTGPTWRFRDAPAGPGGTRYESGGGRGGLPPAWGDPELPLVYVTFGSVAGSLGPFGGIYPAMLEALADQPCRVLMTTGWGFDRGSLPQPASNVKVEAWWPQADVLPHAAALVGHGGFGTTMGGLSAGIPQVVVPLFTTDQLVNAVHVEAAGAGVLLPDWVRAGDHLAAAVHTVLSEPQYERSAQDIAEAMSALPVVAAAVPPLEALAAGRSPVVDGGD